MLAAGEIAAPAVSLPPSIRDTHTLCAFEDECARVVCTKEGVDTPKGPEVALN
jgi:hypothetical protein